MSEKEKTPKDWLGVNLEDFYIEQSPWNFSVSPVIPSRYHHVLYEIPTNLHEPPKPYHNSTLRHWEDDYVRMPYSPESLFIIKENGEDKVVPRWKIICNALSQPINNVEDFERAVGAYNNKLSKFGALRHLFTEVFKEEESQYFFKDLLPKIIQLGLSLPNLVPGNIPILKKNHCKSITLSQLQVGSLLANAFLCTFIYRKESSLTLPNINFTRLYQADARQKRLCSVTEKLKCIIHYFRRITSKSPVGVITFERKFHPRSNMPRWDLSDNNLGNTKVHITSTGTIEEGLGFLQVDFANKFIGGGVLSYGCVQEEIRFVICPELILSRLFVEELENTEAVIVMGVETYSSYTGYGDSFTWNGNVDDQTPFDEFGRRKTTMTVIDATRFIKPKDQFHCSVILRELNKAFVGFSSREKTNLAPVATGNWGCGAFKGDPRLKCLIQLMAASSAGRNLVYYSFGDTELRDDFYKMYLFLGNNGITNSQLWRYLCRFCASNLEQRSLYSFIQQCHFDMKSQPTLKQFLTQNDPKTKSEEGTKARPMAEISKFQKLDIEGKKPVSKKEVSVAGSIENNTPSTSRVFSPKRPHDHKEKQPQKAPNPNEIINIIDILDGKLIKSPDGNPEEESFFQEIDKLRVPEHKPQAEQSTAVVMEIDGPDEVPKAVGFFEDKKRKITDYFFTMANGHSSSFPNLI